MVTTVDQISAKSTRMLTLCLPENRQNKLDRVTFVQIFDLFRKIWCPHTDSNRGPIDYKSIALPAEL